MYKRVSRLFFGVLALLLSNATLARDDVDPKQASATGFRVSSDESGRIVACEITRLSGDAVRDASACGFLVRRARFAIRTEEGKPIAAVQTGQLRFESGEELSVRALTESDGVRYVDQMIVIPQLPESQSPLYLTAHLVLGADAKVERCVPAKSSGVPLVDKAVCNALLVNPIQPAVNRRGQPVRSVWDMRVLVQRSAP